MQIKIKTGTNGNQFFNAREGNNLIRSGKSLAKGLKKKDGGNRPVINLNELNQYITFLYFNMES